MAINSEQFSVNVKGEVSGEQYAGVFKTKLRLSHRDQLRMDQVRRELLGDHADSASPRAQNQADVFSVLAIHLVGDVPKWWEGSNGGLDLEDDNVIAAVYEGVMKAKADAIKAIKGEAEEAKKELAKAKAE